jgi:uncharacterized membrane protein AbrB (regulator of aidB expression)
MRNFINNMLQRTHCYNLWDFGVLKIALAAVGILLGAYFSKFFLANIVYVWIIFGVTYLFIMYKTLVAYRK